jgi:hypothetical protein
MTQPPGPFSGAYGRPGSFGRYGPPPQPPQRNSSLPWLVVGGAVLFSALGILLVVLLGGRVEQPAPQKNATDSAPAAGSSSAGTSASREAATGDLPGGARVAEQHTGADRGRHAGSADVALAWVEAMAQGEFQAAYDLSCAEVQNSVTTAAAGGDPAGELGAYFFEQTLGGQGFTDGSFDSVSYSEAADSDIGSFTLHLDGGEEFVLLVYVQPDLTVCDFG